MGMVCTMPDGHQVVGSTRGERHSIILSVCNSSWWNLCTVSSFLVPFSFVWITILLRLAYHFVITSLSLLRLYVIKSCIGTRTIRFDLVRWGHRWLSTMSIIPKKSYNVESYKCMKESRLQGTVWNFPIFGFLSLLSFLIYRSHLWFHVIPLFHYYIIPLLREIS
jgi:hypothetical protein